MLKGCDLSLFPLCSSVNLKTSANGIRMEQNLLPPSEPDQQGLFSPKHLNSTLLELSALQLFRESFASQNMTIFGICSRIYGV